MVGWHYQLYGHEFEQAPGVGDGQGGLACCSPWGRKELDMSERLNWTELILISQGRKCMRVLSCEMVGLDWNQLHLTHLSVFLKNWVFNNSKNQYITLGYPKSLFGFFYVRAYGKTQMNFLANSIYKLS